MRNIPIYQVDSGVPIPQERLEQLPLEKLEVGESFLFPLAKRRSVQTVASRMKKEKGKEFTVRKMDENNARIWRTK